MINRGPFYSWFITYKEAKFDWRRIHYSYGVCGNWWPRFKWNTKM